MIRYNEITERLGVTERTLRRWCSVLEEQGWVFEKDESNRRFFSEQETLMIAEMKELATNRKLVDAAKELFEKFGTPKDRERINTAFNTELILTELDTLFRGDWLKVILYCNPAPLAIKLLQDKWDDIKSKLG